MGQDREFGDAIIEDGREAAINAGESSYDIEDAGSDAAPAQVPDGERWIDVDLKMRFRVAGEADADMVANAVHARMQAAMESGLLAVVGIAEGTQFESTAEPIEVVKTGGVEQGLR
jgi:hypothetical protein